MVGFFIELSGFKILMDKNPIDQVKEVAKKAKEKWKSRFTWRNIVIVVVVILFAFQYIQVQSVFGTFSFLEGRDSSLITEIGQLRESYSNIGDDLNETRGFLGMSTRSYEDQGFFGDDEETNMDKLRLALFQYVDHVAGEHNTEMSVAQYRGWIDSLLASDSFVNFVSASELIMQPLEETEDALTLMIDSPAGQNIATLYLPFESGVLYFKSILEKVSDDAVSYESFEKDVIAFVERNEDKVLRNIVDLEILKADVGNALASNALREVSLDLGMTIGAGTEQNLQITYPIHNDFGDLIGEIIINTEDLEIWLNDVYAPDTRLQVTDINISLVPFLQTLDTRSVIRKNTDEMKKSLEETLDDRGFKLLLSENDLEISEPREDDQRMYYEISGIDGGIVATIIFEKATGVVNVANGSSNMGENVLHFDPESKKKL